MKIAGSTTVVTGGASGLGRATAERLGDARLANSVMLGAAASGLPFPEQVLRDEVLRRFERGELATRNAAAFDAGRALACQYVEDDIQARP